jgi:hypothetical protein
MMAGAVSCLVAGAGATVGAAVDPGVVRGAAELVRLGGTVVRGGGAMVC